LKHDSIPSLVVIIIIYTLPEGTSFPIVDAFQPAIAEKFPKIFGKTHWKVLRCNAMSELPFTKVVNHQEATNTDDWQHIYRHLYRIASGIAAGETHFREGPTEVVNEALVRLLGKGGRWDSRAHFLASFRRAIDQILIDQSRRREVRNRHADQVARHAEQTSSHIPKNSAQENTEQFHQFHTAITELMGVDERAAESFLLKEIFGFSTMAIANEKNKIDRTIRNDLTRARAFLQAKMSTFNETS